MKTTKREGTPQIYKVIDRSWAFVLKDHGFEHICGIQMEQHEYELLAEDCVLPTYTFGGLAPSKNDCIIRDLEDGTIIFTRKAFLRKGGICPECGQRRQ